MGSARRSYTPRPRARRPTEWSHEPQRTVMSPTYPPCPWNLDGGYVDDADWNEVNYDEAEYELLQTHEPAPRFLADPVEPDLFNLEYAAVQVMDVPDGYEDQPFIIEVN